MGTPKIGQPAQPTEVEKISVGNTKHFRLHTIHSEIEKVAQMMELVVDESGTIDADLEANINQRLSELHLARDIKAGNIGLLIKSMQAEAMLLKKEQEALAKRENTLLNRAAWLTRYLIAFLQTDLSKPGTKVVTPRILISWRRSESLEVRALKRLPMKFLKASISQIGDDELAQHADILRRLKGFTVEPRKDILKRHIKEREQKGHTFRRIAALIQKYTIQIS